MLFRKRDRVRALSERECYLRLHGARSGQIEVVTPCSRPELAAEPELVAAEPRRGAPGKHGPTEERPALHLVFRYPRGGGTMTGEELRLELLRRMQARQGEAA